jgi:hypothetical protein
MRYALPSLPKNKRVTAVALQLLVILVVCIVGQSPPCVDPDPGSPTHWPQAGTGYTGEVRYQFDSSISNGPEKDQITAAVGIWNSKLATTCSGVYFTESSSTDGLPTLIFKNRTSGTAGFTDRTVESGPRHHMV